ncbi:DUF1585 domain-containing protein [Humisphaera borealis]|uniref:DUF1585 domain-containing protein n=1 Tax=Humisphaera borealis TaxID=2807512 RepID=A0A7M2WXQ6_9BACT|nr:DUF1585 domain-containing protein [Humisphaera borealis]QOV89581.1 DUF1585 domain-containing protein [Humisphaera borealis]
MGSFAAEDYLYRSLDKGASVSFKFPDGQGVRYKAGPPVDASGETAQAEPFQNFADFQRLTVSEPKKVARALAAQMITYATGAEPGYADRREINCILSEIKAQHDYSDRLTTWRILCPFADCSACSPLSS